MPDAGSISVDYTPFRHYYDVVFSIVVVLSSVFYFLTLYYKFFVIILFLTLCFYIILLLSLFISLPCSCNWKVTKIARQKKQRNSAAQLHSLPGISNFRHDTRKLNYFVE